MKLSIIVVVHNAFPFVDKCLGSLYKDNLKSTEIIIIDNASQEYGLARIKHKYPFVKYIRNKKNLGFAKAVNMGAKKSKGKYILYLNSDAIITDIDFRDLINLMEMKKEIGALTVKVVLPTGEIDPASHRGFPTLWRSFTYFFGLEKLFFSIPFLNKIFGGYHLVNLNLNNIHEVDVITGAFLLTRREIVDKFGGFDEDYFAYGEDIEMAYQIKKLGYKIIYYPLWKVLHIKSVSGLKKKGNVMIRKKTSAYFYDSMKIFYRKHYAIDHNWLTNKLVYLAIDIKKNINK